MKLSRRSMLQASLLGVAAGFSGRLQAAESPSLPVRAITRGPKFHWFGYYDKLQFDPTNRYVLSNEVEFEHRTPTAADVINVGMVDLEDNDRWIELGQSNAWGWQQGCMLQWRPAHASEVVWNDREGDHFVCRILDVQTRKMRTLPTPIYALSPDGSFAVTADFARIQRHRPGYGYAGVTEKYLNERAPKDSGVFHVDMETGEQKLVLSLRDAANIPFEGEDVSDYWHKFNHLLVSPDSKRFVVLNRWRENDPETNGPSMKKKWNTRMFVGNVDGSDVSALHLTGLISHFVWRDPDHLCMWTKPYDRPAGFYVVNARTSEAKLIGADVMVRDGHNTDVPEHPGWILCDTYPNRQRNQVPYLYRESTNQRFNLGEFYLPIEYSGEWRCDTHPRSSNDGRLVTIDSPHGGQGRQLYLLDVSSILQS
ncbi:hypothetical protein [Planctomicrobium sp. SH664]|uniref:hypothetical protein n=1 Tax=Planctomicrobium sp. SH664 TaxID=3448125 RepID=UPI003F5BACDE